VYSQRVHRRIVSHSFEVEPMSIPLVMINPAKSHVILLPNLDVGVVHDVMVSEIVIERKERGDIQQDLAKSAPRGRR
jgi:hypothetical protein